VIRTKKTKDKQNKKKTTVVFDTKNDWKRYLTENELKELMKNFFTFEFVHERSIFVTGDVDYIDECL
jgi:adenine-specific DNA glycosylase